MSLNDIKELIALESVTEELLRLGRLNPYYTLCDDVMRTVGESYERFNELKEFSRVYGFHTGFGSDITTGFSSEQATVHQRSLLEYLLVGIGPNLPQSVVRRALRLQVIKIAQGYSGISPLVFSRLVALSNEPNLPKVPAYGSLGASGDLIPMAHAIAPIFNDLAEIGGRDVLGLVNTNAMMASLAIELLERVLQIILTGLQITANVSIGIGSRGECFTDPGFAVLRPGNRSGIAAQAIQIFRGELLEGKLPVFSEILQDRYSIRCAPQIYGNALSLLAMAEGLILDEAQNVADNPLVLKEGIWHGGHFYAVGLASAADLLTNILVRIADLCDRQSFLLVNSTENGGLPANLEYPGRSHVKGLHQLANALMQRIRGLATSSWQISASSEGNNQDVVPAAMTALLSVEEVAGMVTDLQRVLLFMSERSVQLRVNGEVQQSHGLKAWGREGASPDYSRNAPP
jgi:histidine ammonia-lyase